MTYYELNKDAIKARKRERYANDPEYRERHKSYNKQYQKDKPEVHRKSSSKWSRDNPNKKNAVTQRSRHSQNTPPWVDHLVIDMIYEDCPNGYEVDHIIPVNGEHVSGLHIAHNLQYLTPTENKTKGSKYNV